MIKIDKVEMENLIRDDTEKFSYQIEPNAITKLQLILTGKITKGIEIFGIGPNEIRALGFLFEYNKEINYAIRNNYKVFVRKEGKYFGQGEWVLEFVKK